MSGMGNFNYGQNKSYSPNNNMQAQPNYQSPWRQNFSYAPGSTTPQQHQYFEGTGPVFGEQPAPVNPGVPPPYRGPMPKPPLERPPTNTPPGPPGGPLPPGMGPDPGTLPPPVNSVPGAPYPGPGTPPSAPNPGMPTPNPGMPTPGGPGIGRPVNPKMGNFLSDNFNQQDVGSPNDRRGESYDLNGNPTQSFSGMATTQQQPPQPKSSFTPPAQNPLLAALYSGQGGAFTPQQINSAGPLGSNKWDPAATSIAGSQAGYNTPAPMFQQGHLANGNATMQNGQFTWTPQGLAAMKANSGVK